MPILFNDNQMARQMFSFIRVARFVDNKFDIYQVTQWDRSSDVRNTCITFLL